MSTDLYAVKVVSRRDRVVVLDVRSLDKETPEVPAEKSFGLMLLHECAGPKTPLAQEASNSEVGDTQWAKRFSNGFIDRVEVAKGRLTITTTHPAWAQHVKPGAKWGSVSFASARGGYAKCKPLAPGDRDTRAAADDAGDASALATRDPDAGMMLAPVELWQRFGLKASSKTVLVPGYPSDSFLALEELAGPFDAKRLKPYVGRNVRITRAKGSKGDRSMDGRLQVGPGVQFALYALDAGGMMITVHRGQFSDIGKMGLLALRPAPSQEPYGYLKVSQQIPTRVVKITTSKSTVRFSLECPPHGGGSVKLEGLGAMLAVLVAPIQTQVESQKPARAPLARSLQADLATGSEFYAEHFTRLAKGYVESFTLDLPKQKQNLDKLSLEEVRALFEAPRPMGELTITATDPHWVKHLEGVKPFELPNDFARPAKLLEFQPRAWKK